MHASISAFIFRIGFALTMQAFNCLHVSLNDSISSSVFKETHFQVRANQPGVQFFNGKPCL